MAKELQRRRLRGGRLLLKGIAQAEVARRVGVSRATVCEWNARLGQGGLEALRLRVRGRPAGLDGAMLTELAQVLKAGAMAQGFATELWSLRRSRLIQPPLRPRPVALHCDRDIPMHASAIRAARVDPMGRTQGRVITGMLELRTADAGRRARRPLLDGFSYQQGKASNI